MVKFSNKTLDDWNELANKELKNKVSNGEQNLSWESEEGIQIKALYTKDDLEGLEHLNTMPGFPPFVRGPKATMYSGDPGQLGNMLVFLQQKSLMLFIEKH